MEDRLRFGIVGCGVITQRTLRGVQAILAAADVEISALCDPDAGNLQATASRLGGAPPATFDEYDRLLEEKAADALLLATPIGLHFEQVKAALDAGLHVYSHKTLAETPQRCKTLDHIAKQRDRRLAASPGQILLPLYRRAADIIRAGEIGHVVSIDACAEAAPHRYEAERADERPAPGRRFSWEWYHSEERGGGPLDDMFVYPLAFLTELFGEATAAAVQGRLVQSVIEWRGRTVEATAMDSYAGVLQFGDVPVTLRSSFSANSSRIPWGTIVVRGSEACLELLKLNDLEYRLYCTCNDGEGSVESYDVFDERKRKSHGDRECHVLTDIEEFVTAIRERRDVRGATALNAARVAAALELIKWSSVNDGAKVLADE